MQHHVIGDVLCGFSMREADDVEFLAGTSTLCCHNNGLANSMEQSPWETGSRAFDLVSFPRLNGIRSSSEPETRLF
jgi:hypothetical protein